MNIQNTIRNHCKSPRNFLPLDQFSNSHTVKNPSCGDSVEIRIASNQGRISSISVTSVGCPICIASGSILSETIDDQSLDYAFKKINQVVREVTSPVSASKSVEGRNQKSGEFDFSGMNLSLRKRNCFLLPWICLKEVLGQIDE